MALTKHSGTVARKAPAPAPPTTRKSKSKSTKVEETTVVLDETENEESV